MKYIVYLGTDSVRGSKGIYTVSLDENGNPSLLGTTPAQDSGYIALSKDGSHLYATVESMVMDGKANGGVGVYKLGSDGLPKLVQRKPANGQLICHISCDSRYVYASSYLTGTVTIYPILPDGTLDDPVHTIRHEKKFGYPPHIHCAKPTADGKYLCVVEVGYHALCLYESESFTKVFETAMKPVRPRQVVCGERFTYCVTEGGKTIEAYAYDMAGTLSHVQSIDVLPPELNGMGASGGIRMFNNTVFASIRSADTITMLSVDEKTGRLERKSVTKAGGDCPRDFNISPDGRFLIAGLQKADKISVFKVDYQNFTLTRAGECINVPSCSCVEFGGAL